MQTSGAIDQLGHYRRDHAVPAGCSAGAEPEVNARLQGGCGVTRPVRSTRVCPLLENLLVLTSRNKGLDRRSW